MERCRRVPSRDGPVGARCVEPAWSEDLGTPVGTDDVVQTKIESRLEDERSLWEAVSWVPDFQCAWQILLQCASPRCHHLLRTVPPSQVARYAHGHDQGMMATMEALLEGLPGDVEQKTWAQTIATMPMRMGGLGLRSATRMSPAAYWASWANALHMISQRLPEGANDIVTQLAGEPAGCLAELQSAANELDRCGFVGRPSWEALKAGARPPAPEVTEPGEWLHGWQHHASSSSEFHYRETMVLSQSSAADQAHLRSHSGPGAGSLFHGSPTQLEYQVQPVLFRTLLLERMRLPLQITEARCESEIRQVAFEGIANRTNPGTSLPRSRGLRQVQLSIA